jgi:hypothetical protein
MADYFSFEEVMGELQIDEDELKRMVSEGELRAFRSENKMKFKREDVDNLKKGRVSEPTVILPSSPTPPQGIPAVDDTALELDLGPDVAEEKKPTEELLPKTSHGEEPLVFDETDVGMEEVTAAKAPDETFAEEDAGAPDTEPLKFQDEPEVATGELTEEAVTAAAPAAAAPSRTRGVAARRASVPTQIPAYVEAQIEKRRAHWIWTVVMCVSLIGTLAYGIVLYDHMRFTTGKVDRPSQLTEGTVRWILKKYWQDERWIKFHTLEFPKPNKEGAEPVAPPFIPKVHRDYNDISFEEPDRTVTQEELEEIRKQIRMRHGEEEPMPDAGTPQ